MIHSHWQKIHHKGTYALVETERMADLKMIKIVCDKACSDVDDSHCTNGVADMDDCKLNKTRGSRTRGSGNAELISTTGSRKWRVRLWLISMQMNSFAKNLRRGST